MAEPLWYYAIDEQQHGPVSPAELKALAESGKLRPDDLVWRAGMDDWRPAREIARLFPAEVLQAAEAAAAEAAGDFAAGVPPSSAPPPAPPLAALAASARPARDSAPPAASGPPPRPAAPLLPAWTAAVSPRHVRCLAGYPLLALGLFLVLWAKGCDSVGALNAQRLQARRQLAENRFDDAWEGRRGQLEAEQQALEELEELTEADRIRLEGLREQLAELPAQQRAERRRLEQGAWRSLRTDARDALAHHRQWAPFYQALFVLGTMVLTAGLILVGVTGEGAERWICLAILAIITLSIYVGGVAWSAAAWPDRP